jgi:outer membrane immunogenic protein
LNKHLIAGALWLSALGASAFGADLPSRAAPQVFTVAQVAPSYSWTGFYVGVDAGYAFNGKADYTHRVNSNFGGIGGLYDNSVDGYTVGGHAGYNQQFGIFVVGLEASAAYANVKGNYNFSQYYNDTTTKISSLFTVTPRIGLTLTDRFLVYVKGGYAGGNVDSGQTYTPPKGAGLFWQNGKFQHGWTIGTGAEYALSQHISIGLEYNYIRLNDTTHTALDSFGTLTAISAKPDLHQAARLQSESIQVLSTGFLPPGLLR